MTRHRPLRFGCVLALLWLGCVALSVCRGPASFLDPRQAAQGVLAAFGLAPELEQGALQTIVELRLWRALVAAGVGGCLAYSGGLVQGVFQNALASPSILGVTGGAAVGASLAILWVGGYGPRGVMESAGDGAFWIPVFGFAGAMAAASIVAFAARGGTRTSVPTLLLVGIAVNMSVAGLFAAIQSWTLQDWEVSRAIMAWTFGTLEDRSSDHVVVIAIAWVLGAAVVPFVATELDLFAGGELDAQGLGVSTTRTKLICLIAAALTASAAVAVAGQIVFVGLVVPHVLRRLSSSAHRALLPLSLVGGGVFLLGTDLAQRWVFGPGVLQPGVVMSLVGGPFFLWILLRHRREMRVW